MSNSIDQLIVDSLDMLIQQGKRSSRDGECAYRGEDGAKCAIGFHIPDELYDVRMEGFEFYALARWSPNVLKFLMDKYKFEGDQEEFKTACSALQGLHDIFDDDELIDEKSLRSYSSMMGHRKEAILAKAWEAFDARKNKEGQ